jgi:hypothetical protein
MWLSQLRLENEKEARARYWRVSHAPPKTTALSYHWLMIYLVRHFQHFEIILIKKKVLEIRVSGPRSC